MLWIAATTLSANPIRTIIDVYHILAIDANAKVLENNLSLLVHILWRACCALWIKFKIVKIDFCKQCLKLFLREFLNLTSYGSRR